MDYNKLKIFLRVAEQMSVTKAAKAMGRTQSAVTQQIKLLEEELELTLFDRKNAKIFLTREGEKLSSLGRKFLGAIDEEMLQLKNDVSRVEGSLTVGVLEDYGCSRLAALLVRFRHKYPKVRFSVRFGTNESIEADLLGNRIDLGILVKFKDRSLFTAREIDFEEHIAVTSRKYWSERGPFTSFESICEADLIDFTDDYLCLGTWIRKNRKSLASRLSHRPPAVLLQSHSGIRSILMEGFGIGLLPRYLVEKDLSKGTLVQLMKASRPVLVGLDIAHPRKQKTRLVEKLFMEECLSSGLKDG